MQTQRLERPREQTRIDLYIHTDLQPLPSLDSDATQQTMSYSTYHPIVFLFLPTCTRRAMRDGHP